MARETVGNLFHAPQCYVCHFIIIHEFKLELSSNWSQIIIFFGHCDLDIWWMTLKNNRTHLLCHFKLWASFCSHLWIQTGVTVWKCSIQVKIVDFSSRLTLKFDRWPTKNNRAALLCHFVHYFVAICKWKCLIWLKIDDFSARVTLKFNGWPRKNNRTPLVCHFKLCASFCSHLWIQTGLIVRKHPNWDKICFDVCDLGPLTLTFCMDITFDNGNNSWKFHDDMMTQTLWTRRSENDNTPQPLDQWTNSPFIGQQVGNCKSFTLTHYLADLFAMHRGPRSNPLCIQHHIQLTSLSFQVSRPSQSWDTAISKFDLENPRSRSWVRS